jgi:fatty acid CoA ligase FadD32
MSPSTFMTNPIVWLQLTISRVRGTCTSSPNFGYLLAAKRWLALGDKKPHLHLSGLTNCMTGAEPITPDVLPLFAETFAPTVQWVPAHRYESLL